MLDAGELRLLTRWCRARHVEWQPGVADDGSAAVLLLVASGGMMMLVAGDDEWRLLDRGERVVAVASGLGELLDAVDAGVAAPVPHRPALPAFVPAVEWARPG